MVVATPAGAIRRVHFEHSIDHAKRILNDRIVRTTDPDTNQFEKTGIDDLFRGKFNTRAGRLIREYQRPVIWVLILAVDSATRIHANVVSGYAGH